MESADVLAARLRDNPADHQAFQALKAHYRRTGDLSSLANLIAGWAGWVADDRAASLGYQEVADLLSGPLSDYERAEEYYLEALRRDPRNLGALDALEAALLAQGMADRAYALRDEHTQSLQDLGAEATVLALVQAGSARLLSESLGRRDDALQLYRAALELEPGLVEALYGARLLLSAQGDLRGATELYEREVMAETDPARRLALLTELSAVFRDELGDLDSAASALERAHDLAPDDSGLQYDLASLLLARAEGADERTARSDRVRAADLLCSVGAALPHEQGVAYFESALAAAPDHESAMAALERALEARDEARLAAHWVAHLAAAAPSRANDRRRVRLARAYARGGQVDDAIYCLEQGDLSFPPAQELLAELRGAPPRKTSTRPPPDQRPTAPPVSGKSRRDSRRTLREEDDAQTVVAEPGRLDALLDEAQAHAYQPSGAAARSTVPPASARASADLGVDAAFDLMEQAAPSPAVPGSAQEARQLRKTAAALAQSQRNEEAAQHYELLLAADPLDREAFAFLDGFYRRKQLHDRRAALLEHSGLLDVLPKATRASRLREASAIYESRLKDAAAAARAMQHWAQLEPESEEAQRGLRRVLERAERWDDLAQLTEADFAEARTPEQQLTLLRRLLALYRDRVGDLHRTAFTLERLLVLRPDDRATRDALLELLPTLGRHADCVPLMEEKIRDAQRAQKPALLHELARLYAGKLGDPERAFATYERVVELAPGDLDALEQMARLDHQSGNMERLLATLDRQVERLDGERGAAMLARMAQIAHAELGDTMQAISLLARAVERAPERAEHAEALAGLYEATQRHADLVLLLRERARLERNAPARVEILRRIARVEQTELEDGDAAERTWLELLKLREDLEALHALYARAEQRGELDVIAQLLTRIAALAQEPGERRDLLLQRADLLLRQLGRPQDAIADLARILLEIDPGCDPALEALWEASQAATDYRGLCRVLEHRLSHARTAQTQLALAKQLADLYAKALPNPEAAQRAHGHWIAADPSDPEPHRRNRPLLARTRREPELLLTLDALSQLEPEPTARFRATIDAAELAGKLGDVDGGIARLWPLVEQRVPDAVDSLVALARAHKRDAQLYDLLERAGDIERLLALLRDRVAREEDPKTAAGLLRRTAQLLIDYAQDEDGAAEAYTKLLALEEDVDALRFLQARATRRDDPATLADVLSRLAALERNPEERRTLLIERGRLLHARLGRAKEAVQLLVALTRESEAPDAAWDELVLACQTASDHKTLATTLERLLPRSADPARRIAIAQQLADVCEGPLREPTRALAALTAWTEADPRDAVPQRRRRPLLVGLGRHAELLMCLDALTQIEQADSARLEATLAASALCRNQLKDPIGAWQRLLPHVGRADAQVDKALFTLAGETSRHDELYAALERENRHETLVAWIEQRVVHEQDPALRVTLLRRMARTLAGPLDDPRAAEHAYTQLLAHQEDQEALLFVRTFALQHDDVPRLADALRRLAAIEQDPTEKRDLLYEQGRLLHARLAQPAEAIAVLAHVLSELDPEFEPALDELIEAATAADDPAWLAFALERLLALERDPERSVEVARRLADLCEERLRDVPRTVAALARWAEAAPADPTPHERTLALVDEVEEPGAAMAQLDAIAAKHADAGKRLEASLRSATLAFERVGDADAAWARLEPLINTGSLEAEALATRVAFASGRAERLIALYAAAQRHDDLVAVLRHQAERTSDPATKAELYRRCAHVLADALGDELAAAEAYRESLRYGEHLDALTFLRELCERTDASEELAHVLSRLQHLAPDPEAKRDLVVERALLLADRLERPDEAIAELRRVLVELDPNCRPAIEELSALCETHEDYPGLALALERQLANAGSPAAAADAASRLAGVYEDRLHDAERARQALQAWQRAAPSDPEPLRRLRPLLEAQQQWPELLAILDALAATESSAEARSEARLAAADLASERLGDPPAGLSRVSEAMLAFDAPAEEKARAIAEAGQLLRGLANLYVLRAQRPRSPHGASDWRKAAALYEQMGEAKDALEATLRALALDLEDRGLLDAIDRLAIATGAWDRLERVYARLIQQAELPEQVALIRRHAELLERRANNPAGALERLMAACKLDPSNTGLLDHAEALASALSAHVELEWIAERRQRFASTDEDRARLLLRQAKIADLGMKDREQALRNLRAALALTEQLPHVAAEVEDAARELDRARPELGAQDALRSLVRAHVELAQEKGEPFGPVLVLRASQLLHEELRDDAACFDVLKQGAQSFPEDLDLYDALELAAVRIKRLDALEAHLARASQRVQDAELKRGLLRRRAKVLGEHLQRHAKAAEAYREILTLDPDDSGARQALPRMLREAGRYQELLKLYDVWLSDHLEAPARQRLLREKAQLWEIDLRNRPAALECWLELLAVAPEDAEAQGAVSRLQANLAQTS